MAIATLPDQQWIDQVGPVEGVDLRVWDLTGPPPQPEDVRFVVPPYMRPASQLRALSSTPALEVVQLLTAGFDGVLDLVPSGATVCNAGGVHDTSTAELALALTLASLRGIPEFGANQATGTWEPLVVRPSLADSRVMVLGYGSIGRAIATRLAPFEVELMAVASRPRGGDDLVAEVHGVAELPDLLPNTHVVIVITPLVDATRGLVGRGFLAALPDGALVVNVARGGVVDTDALVAETSSGRLRAALDVTEPEPLPADHPLWRTPGVLVTPHVGGATTAFQPRAVRLVRAQLSAWATARPLANVVKPGA